MQRRKPLIFGIYFALVTVPIFIYFLLYNTPGVVHNTTGFVQTKLTKMLKFTFSKTSETNKVNSTGIAGTSTLPLLDNHYFKCSEPFGRLGNLLFQCASAFGIAHTLRYHFCIQPSHPLNNYFNINHTCGPNIINMKTFDEMQCRKESWRYNKSYLSYNLTTSGYLQSWKYFDNNSKEIRNILSFKPNFLRKAQEFLTFLKKCSENMSIIGVHVRRGDFLTDVYTKMGYTAANMEYITRAMSFYRHKAGSPVFVVASDDINWCKDNIKGPDIRYSNFTEPADDLALLSLCDHAIITGGSFGWWSGWLCGGTVVYLKDFPRPGSVLENLTYNAKGDYYPPHWIGFNNS